MACSWTLPGWDQLVWAVCCEWEWQGYGLFSHLEPIPNTCSIHKMSCPHFNELKSKNVSNIKLVFTEFKEISCSCCWMRMDNDVFDPLDLIIFEIRKTLFIEPQNSTTRKPFRDYWQVILQMKIVEVKLLAQDQWPGSYYFFLSRLLVLKRVD